MKRYKDMTEEERDELRSGCIFFGGLGIVSYLSYKAWMRFVTKSVKKVLMKQHGIYFVEV